MVKNEFPIILDGEDYLERLEEERRIFYVGLTRAKNSLYLLTLKKRNKKSVDPSIFYKNSQEIIKNSLGPKK